MADAFEDHRAAVRQLALEHLHIVDAQQGVLAAPQNQRRGFDFRQHAAPLQAHGRVQIDVLPHLFRHVRVGGFLLAHQRDGEIGNAHGAFAGPVQGGAEILGAVRNQRVAVRLLQHIEKFRCLQGDAGGIHQAQGAEPVRLAPGHLDGDGAAHGVAGHVGALHLQGVEQAEQALGLLTDTVIHVGGARLGVAVAGQVGNHETVVAFQFVGEAHPVARIGAEAVDQQHRRGLVGVAGLQHPPAQAVVGGDGVLFEPGAPFFKIHSLVVNPPLAAFAAGQQHQRRRQH